MIARQCARDPRLHATCRCWDARDAPTHTSDTCVHLRALYEGTHHAPAPTAQPDSGTAVRTTAANRPTTPAPETYVSRAVNPPAHVPRPVALQPPRTVRLPPEWEHGGYMRRQQQQHQQQQHEHQHRHAPPPRTPGLEEQANQDLTTGARKHIVAGDNKTSGNSLVKTPALVRTSPAPQHSGALEHRPAALQNYFKQSSLPGPGRKVSMHLS